jgi:hydroxyacylglutathione hydrolase
MTRVIEWLLGVFGTPGASPQRAGTSLALYVRMRIPLKIHRIAGGMAYSYLLETPAALFLVDGGMRGTGRRILRRIAQIGRKPEQLAFAIVTHGHPDHFGGLAEVQEASGCVIVCHPSHAETIRTGHGIVSPGLNAFGRIYERIARLTLPKLRLPKLRRVVSVADGARLHRFGLPGRIMYTPGHSTGDLTLVLDDGSAFVGDLVQGRRIPRVTPPEFSIMAVDVPDMFASWLRLLRSGAKVLYPGHGHVVTIEEMASVFRRTTRRRRLRARTEGSAA